MRLGDASALQGLYSSGRDHYRTSRERAPAVPADARSLRRCTRCGAERARAVRRQIPLPRRTRVALRSRAFELAGKVQSIHEIFSKTFCHPVCQPPATCQAKLTRQPARPIPPPTPDRTTQTYVQESGALAFGKYEVVGAACFFSSGMRTSCVAPLPARIFSRGISSQPTLSRAGSGACKSAMRRRNLIWFGSMRATRGSCGTWGILSGISFGDGG